MSSKSSNSILDQLVDRICNFFLPLSRFETKLVRCQGYRRKSIGRWKQQAGFTRATTNKILKNLYVFDSRQIRSLVRAAVSLRPDIFEGEKCYVTSFGSRGKSGEVIFYEFSHAVSISDKTIEPWQISALPSDSRIVFVDDLIGTGAQSLDYIQTHLNLLLAPSHKPCLFSICGTPGGMDRVKGNSGFEVVCGMELKEERFNHYHENNRIFSPEEKASFEQLSERLGRNLFDMGLLVAFYYSTPDNTMPFIWNEGFQFLDNEGKTSPWFALLPRKY